MLGNEFEAGQRAREWFHSLTVPPGAWTVIRVDGRSFSRFTREHYDKPYDARFSELMATTAQTLLSEFDGSYAYTESDEISVLLDPGLDLFGRSVEKLVSISAGIASAAFTHAAGRPAHFDSRIWLGTGRADVVDYFSWRQADAARCGLNGWCYWTLREAGRSPQEATRLLERTTPADKNEMLFQHGVNFNEIPAWQRRGVGLWWENFERPGYDPIRETPVTATRRRVRVERDLPMKDAYRTFINDLIS
ncbi:tRNA(His) guanylyltransferase Thg1 family protein [Actinophytocola sp.]|uniref:tRNA(His) guanylyltransferase Thg1 family protein n=1 Tax=Actinophytocola sp. TaxID=1872138 RepID=UPI002D80138E|nr:tRNA(His) guanylyltransferase Thg1 family protein [Actinophytocola sp.]HET9143459.1 tRNA(His) guanylyltransferase Thg1 family protein [Actinophytocola sp.]